MDSASWNVWIAFAGLVGAFIVYVIHATNYISAIKLDCRETVAEMRNETMRQIDVSKELMLAVLEKELQKEGKARHDVANHVQTQITSLDKDYRGLVDRMGLMVHKGDLSAMEARFTTYLDKMEKKLEDLLNGLKK